MKKTITQEINVCDSCHSDSNVDYECLHCGKTYCMECVKDPTKVVYYLQGALTRGSRDGIYCVACDELLRHEGMDELHQAYRMVQFIGKEMRLVHAKLRIRQLAAEKRIEELLKRRTVNGRQ